MPIKNDYNWMSNRRKPANELVNGDIELSEIKQNVRHYNVDRCRASNGENENEEVNLSFHVFKIPDASTCREMNLRGVR